jgi:hypothetical protein
MSADLPEAIRRGVEIVQRGDPWSIVQLRHASPHAGRLELLALFERAASAIRAVGTLNEHGRHALELLTAAISASSGLDEAAVYPWHLISGERAAPSKPPARERAPSKPAASIPVDEPRFLEIVNRAIRAVQRTNPTAVTPIVHRPNPAECRRLAAVFADHSAMIQSASAWGGIGWEGHDAIEALDAAVALLDQATEG